MDTTLLINPVVTPSIVAILATGAVLAAVIWQRAAIATMLSTTRAKLFTRSGFFWSAIAVFMAISVWQAGTFFSISGDLVGFVVPFFLDMVTVILMQAMLESRYRDEHARANMFLFFIIVTCAMSTYANFAIAQNTFDANKMLKNASQPVKDLAPYALASFPLFVIMMSIAAEKVVNVRPLDKLEESEYDADETKRVRLIEIRNKHAIRQAEIEAGKEARLQQLKIQRAGQRAEHKAAMKQIKNKESKKTPAPQPQTPALVQQQITAPQPQATNEQNTDALEASQIQAAINESKQEPVSNQPEIVEEPKRDCAWYRSQGHTNLTVQETAMLCDTNEQVIKSLRTKTILKSPSPNSTLITLASIEVYLSGRKQGSRNRKQSTTSVPVIESTTNEDATNDTASLDRLLATASMPKFSSNGHGTKETVKLDELEEMFA